MVLYTVVVRRIYKEDGSWKNIKYTIEEELEEKWTIEEVKEDAMQTWGGDGMLRVREADLWSLDLGAFWEVYTRNQNVRKATYVKFILGICIEISEDKITRHLDIDQNRWWNCAIIVVGEFKLMCTQWAYDDEGAVTSLWN